MNKLRRFDTPLLSPKKANGLVSGTVKLVDHGSNITEMQAYSAREQLWATRALKAEALLVAKEDHYRELKEMAATQELKLSREIEKLMLEHKEKHSYLEKLVLVLATVVILLLLVIIYLATHYTQHVTKAQRPWFSGLPSHFTIPILSPFTSVVEQETSVFGARVIAVISVVLGTLAFFVFRHWFNSTGMTR